MATSNTPDIIYTKVDEAPELASASLSSSALQRLLA